ncbi:MAG: 1,5-anhydro-D-fructose reductase [candidate division BRC1 bacterium ADurb.BinA364]|nr:MAG: 1,5-anhydro-D-fructose reductase [candidate division BRC1 bacterium ADurb.BinA364]
MADKIRWGILGPGKITIRFMQGMKAVPEAKVHAVASRDLGRAQAFASEYGAARAYEGYENLAADPDVDIVYVATPHPFHAEHAMMAMRAGKAVLCEKPLTVNAAQAKAMIDCARESGVFLMEAMWTRWIPAIERVRQWLAQGAIGETLMLQANFAFRAGWNPEGRLLNLAMAGGGLLDVGIYCVSFASMVFGRQPEKIASLAKIGLSGVDEQAGMTFLYPDGQIALLSTGVRLRTPNHAFILGSEGEIEIPAGFYNTEKAILRAGKNVETVQMPHRANGFEYEIMEAHRCLRQGRKETEALPLDESLAIMQTMDAIRAQWGLKYPFE